MNKTYVTIFAILAVHSTFACPTRVKNDSNFIIGLADHDLGNSPAENDFVEIVQPNTEASKNVTPQEHDFFVYAKQGNGFVKKLEVIFNFCGSIQGADQDAEHMSYTDIDKEKIVTDNAKWAKGKFTVNHF